MRNLEESITESPLGEYEIPKAINIFRDLQEILFFFFDGLTDP